MLARAESVAVIGLEGHRVGVEVSIAQGLPAFTIVGLPDVSVQESRERVRAAIQNSNEEWPQKRITVNLSPANLRKAGPGFDLAIAVAVVAANGRLPEDRLRRICLIGELSLDGAVRRVRGALAAAMAARQHDLRAVIVPEGNAAEAALVEGVEVYAVDHLARAIKFLRGEGRIDHYTGAGAAKAEPPEEIDFADVRGQDNAKKALEIAAAGGHNLLMSGTPGGGKTMLARRLPTIMPPLSHSEALEVTRIYSVAGLLPDEAGLVRRRPFRAPHHTVSTTGLVGGGSSGLPQPGEVSLAHRGVLFLDEASEFRRDALQALRGPIEDGAVTIVRTKFAVTYPSRLQLVVATNPCPCGFFGDDRKACTCPPGRLTSYNERLSGPILDRIDLQVPVGRLRRGELLQSDTGDPSQLIRERVIAARLRQQDRLSRFGFTTNAEIPPQMLDRLCPRTKVANRMLERQVEKMTLSARGAHRVLRVARTVADLADLDVIDDGHVIAASAYKVLDVRATKEKDDEPERS